MDKIQALNLLTQVARQYKGNAEEHELLKKALSVIAEEIKDKKDSQAEKKSQESVSRTWIWPNTGQAYLCSILEQ